MAKLEPGWRFTAVDPSGPMLEAAKQQLAANNLLGRTALHLGHVEDLVANGSYDAATLIGVLHHLDGDEAKLKILRSIQAHLKPGAPLIVAAVQKLLSDAGFGSATRFFSSLFWSAWLTCKTA